MTRSGLLFKDRILDELATDANVAQFVSFGPDLKQRHSRVRDFAPNHQFTSIEEAVAALLRTSPEASVNIRSFEPAQPRSREFVYGLRKPDVVAGHVRRLARDGLMTIVNETVAVDDGGVSGVVLGDVIEFAPGDTPRCVEKAGTAALPREIGTRMLETVYGFRPSLGFPWSERVEFSVHPLRRGYRNEHTIIWEAESVDGAESVGADIRWPNHFSRLLGDKAFGLLVGQMLGLPVPRTTVVPRALAPFSFGRSTGTGEVWLRTCPVEQVPGRFTTQRGWRDPYQLMNEEDPEGGAIASVLAQEGVESVYAGALITGPGGHIVEGVRGSGIGFMIGRVAPEELPADVTRSVARLYESLAEVLGAARFEWVYDGKEVWIVQLHRGPTETVGRVLHPGTASSYVGFDASRGLEELRALVARVQGTGQGIVLVGQVGVTSHFGDVLRRAKVPSHIESPA
jgi:hypothetical protein